MPCCVPTCLRGDERMSSFPSDNVLAKRWFEAIEFGCGYPMNVAEDDCHPEICSYHFTQPNPYSYEEPSRFIDGDGTSTQIGSCRMCLTFHASKDMVAIAGTVADRPIASLLDTMGINFLEDDFLQLICVTCLARLEMFTFLHTKVAQSELEFQHLLEKSQDIVLHTDIKPEEVPFVDIIKEEILLESEISIKDVSDDEYIPMDQEEESSSLTVKREKKSSKSHSKSVPNVSLQEKIERSCYICDTIHPDVSQLLIHLTKSHSSEMGYRCDECSLDIPLVYAYNRHLSRHNELRMRFQCSMCSLRFSSDFRVKIHENKVHGANHNVKPVVTKLREVICDQCGKVSDSRRIKDHIQEVHQRDSLPKCDICQKIFTTKRSLERHMLLHSNTKPYSCDQCDATFRRLLDYRHHKSKVHDGVNPHVCPECNEEFKSYHQLYVHKQGVHYKKVPKSMLSAYRQNKQYEVCKICRSQFAKGSELMQHIRSEHVVEQYPVLKCPHCIKTFILPSRLSAHKAIHSDRYACKECGVGHIDKKKLQYHMDLKHPDGRVYACSTCSTTFTSLNQLNEHSVIHTKGKRFQCEFCTKSFLRRFQLVIHTRTHTGEKPFECSGCLKRFGDDGTFSKHKKTCRALQSQ
ncbi:zinc finger protein 420-like [Sabethes cyaneus]|uniref:zinc finger protein 420-like n=1 Tax=Sabethes cyaneus TaxID=53552 RepID=UPI00237E4257|nr:zinc finger protein 420-like [Sabethes cyaneus]